jgi:hypothetical protein
VRVERGLGAAAHRVEVGEPALRLGHAGGEHDEQPLRVAPASAASTTASLDP